MKRTWPALLPAVILGLAWSGPAGAGSNPAPAVTAKGVDAIVCVAVNDPFVLGAWEKIRNVDGKVNVLSDGNAEFTRALGLDFDGSAVGLGTRSKRYAMIVDDGMVKALMVEDAPAKAEKSSASAILAAL